MLKFSVLLSVYKNENAFFFNDAFESIYNSQSLKPNEIVLVQDGPLTDNLYHIIDHWKKELHDILKIVSIPSNVGLGNALNIGISHCTYDWIFRMDTDDISLPDRFEKQIKFILNNPTISLLSANIEEFDESMSQSLGCRNLPSSLTGIKKLIKSRSPFNHVSVAFKKNDVISAGGYQHHLYMEDYNLWIRMLSSGFNAANVDEILVNVRSGTSMIKRRKGSIYIKSEFKLAKLKIKYNIDNRFSAYSIFILRSASRLLPSYLLAKVYYQLRA
ncbi:glycosyltransferase [Providencia sp.]|uniref:glycosyltransferase n=1 Tax=Providencia sp. TaxID=589 RepID=UPI003F973531